MEKSVGQQIGFLRDPSPRVREAARQAIQKYGRFSEPILKRLLAQETDAAARAQLAGLIESAGGEAEVAKN
jgi:hypothetical protein